MNVLKRALYLQAAVWTAVGVALAVVPRFVIETLFGQPALSEPAWLRILGLQTLCVAMLMVLVGHRVRELWWWAWAFELVDVGLVLVVVLRAALGRAPGEPALLWWLFALVALGFGFFMLYGLFVSSREEPLP